MKHPQRKSTQKTKLMLAALLALLAGLAASCGSSSQAPATPTTELIEENSFPTSISVSHAGDRLYVTNNVRNTVSVIDSSSLKTLAQVSLGCAPRMSIVSEDDKTLIVGHDNNSECKRSPLYVPTGEGDEDTGVSYTFLSIIDLTTNTLTKEVKLQSMESPGFSSGQSMESVRSIIWDTSADPERLYVSSLSKSDLAILDMDVIMNAATAQVSFDEDNYGEIIGYYKGFSGPVDMALTTASPSVFFPQTEANTDKLSAFDLENKAEYTTSPWDLTFTYSVDSGGNISARNGYCKTPSYIDVTSDEKTAVISCNDKSDTFSMGDGTKDVIIAVDISNPSSASTDNRVYGYLDICNHPLNVELSSDEKYLLAICDEDDGLVVIPWDEFSGITSNGVNTNFIEGWSYYVGINPSGLAINGTNAYVTDLSSDRVYKYDYTDKLASKGIIKFPIDPAKKAF